MSARAVTGRARPGLPLGVWGIGLLIATEAALFAVLIGSYWYLRYHDAQWPPAGIDHPHVVLPLAITAGLVLTTPLGLLAARAGARGDLGGSVGPLGLMFVLQAAYLAAAILILRDDLHHVGPRAQAYGSIYTVLSVLHAAHVAVGLLLEGALLGKLASGLTPYRVTGLYAVAAYSAFVAAVAIPVVLTEVSPGL